MTLFWWLYIAANWLINFLDLCSLQILYLNDLAHVLLFLRKNFTLGTYRPLNAPLEKTINFLFLSPFVFTFKERIAQQPQEKSTNIFKMFWSLIFAKVEWFYLVNTNLSKGSNKDPKTSSVNLLTKQKKSLFNGVSFLCSVCVILDYLDIVSSKIFTWVIISFFDLRKCLNSFAWILFWVSFLEGSIK